MNNYYHYNGWNVEKDSSTNKYIVLDYRNPNGEKYTFDTKWAADEMCRFCRATDPPPQVTGLIFTSQYSLGKNIQFAGITVAEFDDKGNVTKFHLMKLVKLWLVNTDVVRFCKKLWYGFSEKSS